MEEDIEVSSEMAVYCVCRNVMSLIIIITIIFSQYVPLRVNVCKWWGISRKKKRGLYHCLLGKN